MDPETLTEVLAGRHLNMEERTERGAWPHPPLRYDDLLQHLAKVITKRQWFPGPVPANHPPRVGWVADFVIIEHRNPHDFLVHVQSAGPSGQTIAQQAVHRFRNPEEAAAFYLEWGLHLPGDLDGWQVVR